MKTCLNRRKFIKIMGLGTGSVFLSSSLEVGNAFAESNIDYGWYDPSQQSSDIRMQVLAYAILSPNPHNKQAWLIQMTDTSSFDLYVDSERLLPETDPYYRQVHIGQGTFLETLAIAATGLGYVANITYFPKGTYGNTELLGKPIASINLIKQADVKVDPLFKHILNRRSNKRVYDGSSISKQEMETLLDFHGCNPPYSLTIKQNPCAKQQLRAMLTEAMQIEVTDLRRSLETIKMFRFNDAEVEQYRDGFGVAQSGMSGLKKFIVEIFLLSRQATEKDPSLFEQQSVDIVQEVVASTTAFAWITTPSNTRLDQVKVGRDYCRINLKTEMMGLVQHPLSQVLQEYEDMKSLQTKFKRVFSIKETETVQMLFRLGKAEPTTHTPRRLLHQLIQV